MPNRNEYAIQKATRYIQVKNKSRKSLYIKFIENIRDKYEKQVKDEDTSNAESVDSRINDFPEPNSDDDEYNERYSAIDEEELAPDVD